MISEEECLPSLVIVHDKKQKQRCIVNIQLLKIKLAKIIYFVTLCNWLALQFIVSISDIKKKSFGSGTIRFKKCKFLHVIHAAQ